MAKRCVINCSVGFWYPRGHDRLQKSLKDVGFKSDFISWRNKYPPGCPPHEEVPDAFKAYAFEYVMAKGYTSILWLDASCWAVRPLEPFFDLIEERGHFFQVNAWTVGQWCKDSALKTLRLEREMSFSIPDLNGMCLGVDVTNERTAGWMKEFIEICKDRVTLPGPFPTCKPGEISDDPRVLGHAHEQTVASALAYHYKMDLTPASEGWLHRVLPHDKTNDKAVIYAAGM